MVVISIIHWINININTYISIHFIIQFPSNSYCGSSKPQMTGEYSKIIISYERNRRKKYPKKKFVCFVTGVPGIF